MSNAPGMRNRALDDLAEAGQPWWRRYSPHGEFPWSSTLSLLFHGFLVVLTIVLARQLIIPDREPPGVATVQVGNDPEVAAGDGGTDQAGGEPGEPTTTPQEEKQPTEMPQPKTLPEEKHEELTEVKPQEAPDAGIAVPVPDPKAMPDDKVPDDVRKRIEGVKKRLAARSQPKSGKGGSGGPGAGIGGSGGAGLTGRAARAARWILVTEGPSIQSYLAQLDGLGAVIAFPARGNRFLFFYNISSPNRTSEEKDLPDDNRPVWTTEKPQTVRDVCQFVGIPQADMWIMFLPVELENRMADMEKSYQNKEEDEILQTRFKTIRKGSGYDVTVIQQILR